MDEFLLLFRRDFTNTAIQPSGEELNTHLQQWKSWFEKLTTEDRLARKLQRWDGGGKVVKKGNTVINGPYVEIKESIGGLIIIKAEDYNDAEEVAKGCPILDLDGTVEIRRAF